MKIADVVVGGMYEAKISGFRGPVVVKREIQDHSGRRLFEVYRPGTPKKLMRRTAAALHALSPHWRRELGLPAPATVERITQAAVAVHTAGGSPEMVKAAVDAIVQAEKPAALAPTSGYVPCACRDCMETAIGSADALCHDCEAAGCEPHVERECSSPSAYGCSDE